MAIALKLHNLYSLHMKADGLEESGSASDLNEPSITPV